MSFESPVEATYLGYKFVGLSLAGIRTAIAMPELNLSFDVAYGPAYLHTIKKFFITHGHLDHASGIPYIISQKAMTSQPPAQFYMPKSLAEPLDQILKIWQKIEGHQYQYEFIGVDSDIEINLTSTSFVKTFPTTHRVQSLGYTLFDRNKKLKAEFANATREEIIQAKQRNIEITDYIEKPLVSFTGDTQIEFLDSRPWIRHSKILFLEATYLDDKRSLEQARKWGHTHLDEIVPRLKDIESEKIVLIHLSSRYSTAEATEILKQKVPSEFHDRVSLFLGR